LVVEGDHGFGRADGDGEIRVIPILAVGILIRHGFGPHGQEVGVGETNRRDAVVLEHDIIQGEME